MNPLAIVGLIVLILLGVGCWIAAYVCVCFSVMSYNGKWNRELLFAVILFIVGCALFFASYHYSPFELIMITRKGDR